MSSPTTRRIEKIILSARGFIPLFMAITGIVHFVYSVPQLSFRFWDQAIAHPWIQTVRDLLGRSNLQASLLHSTIEVNQLTAGQGNWIRLLYRNPGQYVLFMWIFLVCSVVSLGVLGSFLYNLAVRPIRDKRKQILGLDDVAVPSWYPDQEEFSLVLGLQHHERDLELVENPSLVKLPYRSLRTGLMITGTTGTGKTYGCLYPYTRQVLHFRPNDPEKKPGMLVLDVKGNYCDTVLDFIDEIGRRDDVIIIELGGNYFYNPLHKPHLRPAVVANRLRTILETFSTGKNSDSYWLDKAESMISEAIKLARLYRGGYVTFADVDAIIRKQQASVWIEEVRKRRESDQLTPEEIEMFRTVVDYFQFEYAGYDDKIRSIIESEVTRMTATFTSDPLITRTFCPTRDQLNFFGFDELVDKGKIVLLRMNAEEYQNLAKIMSTYLKLDFQSSVMMRLKRPEANRERPLVFINDEYHFMASRSDAKFFSVCREPGCVNIVATQSFTSLLEALGDKTAVETILQNLVNKIWLRSDDTNTIKSAQEATGRDIKERRSESITESGKDSNYSWVFGRSVASDSNLSKSVSYQTVEDYIFPYDFFRQQLRILTGVAFLYEGSPIGSIAQDIRVTALHLIGFDKLPWHTRFTAKRAHKQVGQFNQEAIVLRDDFVSTATTPDYQDPRRIKDLESDEEFVFNVLPGESTASIPHEMKSDSESAEKQRQLQRTFDDMFEG